jgi:hypothetical protein
MTQIPPGLHLYSPQSRACASAAARLLCTAFFFWSGKIGCLTAFMRLLRATQTNTHAQTTRETIPPRTIPAMTLLESLGEWRSVDGSEVDEVAKAGFSDNTEDAISFGMVSPEVIRTSAPRAARIRASSIWLVFGLMAPTICFSLYESGGA